MGRSPYVFATKFKSAYHGPDAGIVKDQLFKLQQWSADVRQGYGLEQFAEKFFWILRKNPEKGERQIQFETERWNTRLIPFRFNNIQKDIVKKLAKRNIFLKPRQGGYTTWMIIMRLLLPAIIDPGTGGLLISQNSAYATAHFSILKRAYRYFGFGDPFNVMSPVNGWAMNLHKHLLHVAYSSRKELIFDQLDSRVICASAEVEEVGQGLTVQHLACTEVARWEGNPEETLANVKESVPSDGTIDIESTANMLGGYFYEECFDKDTEVLTRRGWLKWRKVRKWDKFATRDKFGRFVWQHASKLHRYFYRGEMLHFKDRTTDVMVTPRHRMLGWRTRDHLVNVLDTKQPHLRGRGAEGAPLEFMLASDVGQLPYWHGKFPFRVPSTSKWRGVFPETFDGDTGKIRLLAPAGGIGYDVDLKDWVAFLGLYIAEGCASGTWRHMDKHRRGKGIKSKPLYIQAIAAARDKSAVRPTGRCYAVGIAQRRTSKHFKEMDDLLSRLPFGFKYSDGNESWNASSKTLHSILSCCGNTYTKRVPQWVKDLPPRYLKVFVEWAAKGDGWITDYDLCIYSTCSKKLADDMQELYLKMGRWASIRKVDRRRGEVFGKVTDFADFYIVKDHIKDFQSLGRPERVGYDGYVYCATVPNGTLYIRRNGVPLWCGNCMRSERGDSEFQWHFHPWYYHEEYVLPESPVEPASLTGEEKAIIKGAEQQYKIILDLGHIAWRRMKKRSLRHNFAEKYPEDSRSCFLLQGNAYFDNEILGLRLKEIEAEAPIDKFKRLKIYRKPLKHKRYVIGVDPQGGISATPDSLDFAAAQVLEVETGEQVATYHARMPPEDLAEELAELGRFYNNALIACERTGDGHTVMYVMQVTFQYTNIFKFRHPAKRDWPNKVGKKNTNNSIGRLKDIEGIPTTGLTRPILLNRAAVLIRKTPECLHDLDTVKECLTFIRNPDKQGKPMAAPGCYDDCVMSLALGNFARLVLVGYISTEMLTAESYDEPVDEEVEA